MPACAIALPPEAMPAIAVSAAVITVLRSIMASLACDSAAHSIAQRNDGCRSTNRYGSVA
jgi:hypothetical protein